MCKLLLCDSALNLQYYILVFILQINDLGNIFYNTLNYNIYNYMTVLAAGLTSLTLMLYVRTQLNHDWRRLLIFIVLKNALATVLAAILINFSNESQDLVIIRMGTLILIELLIIVLYFDVLKKLMMVDIFDFRLASIDNNIMVRLLKNLPIAVLSGAIPFGERMAVSSIVNSVDFRDYVIAIQLLSPLSLFIGAANQVKIRFLMSKDTNNNDLFAYLKLIAILSVGYVGLLFFAAYAFSLFLDEIKNLPQMLLLISPLVTMQIFCQILVTRCIGIGQEISVLVFNLSLCCYLVFSVIVIQNLVVFLLFFFAVYILFSLKFVRVLR